MLSLFQVSVQMSKVLLHLEDRYNTVGFYKLRQNAMVALTVTHTQPVRLSRHTHHTQHFSKTECLGVSAVIVMLCPFTGLTKYSTRVCHVVNVKKYGVACNIPVHISFSGGGLWFFHTNTHQ